MSDTPRSYKAQVRVTYDEKWYDNALRFPTREEATEYARDLFQRWTQTSEWQVVTPTDAPTHRWVVGVGVRSLEDACKQIIAAEEGRDC